ncbi:VirK/YbjX family protein [Luteibacter anthropi]|uniref:VirK/YbjX family protein n=1 Tax=Luteibacter anthropi TaxID=564369 RepID=UPI002032BB56|nr:DUF535 family protein [Luteibacter anthropi]URX63308.1 VirK/YbjX family protein [Luteibacter anthropi]
MQSLLRFARSLRGRASWHSKRIRGLSATLTYVGRSMVRFRRHDAWLALLESPDMAGLTSVDVTLLERYQHRYISRQWSRDRRLDVLRSHYEFAVARFPRELFDTLYRSRQIRLGRIELRDGSGLNLILKAPRLRDREGELSISLTDDNGLQISYASISFIDGGRSIVIGCLQGASNNAGRDAVRDFTKQCHGLRPKNLLLSMIRSLAEVYGVERVLGISNAAHPFGGRRDKIKADYDTFWLEAEGVAVEDGFYAMAPREPTRCASEVESKRRSEFRRREALRHQACALLVGAFGFRLENVSMAA